MATLRRFPTFSQMIQKKVPRGYYITTPLCRKKDKKKFIHIWNTIKEEYTGDEDSFDKQVKRILKRVKKEGDDFLRNRVEIQFIDPILGYGVFAKKNLPKGSIVGEYVGLIKYLTPLEDKKLSATNGYLFEFSDIKELDNFVVDAKTYGNFIRFINHAKKGSKKENIEAYIYCDSEGPHIIYTAKKEIKKGQELRLDYGADTYWKNAPYDPI